MLLEKYQAIRRHSEEICGPLKTEDYVVQPIADVSPPKWHLGHTTWFFETFILKPHLHGYQEFNSEYDYVFNSYYETVGNRVIRTDRGNLSRPTVEEVYAYRKYVDAAMAVLLNDGSNQSEIKDLLVLGFNHEEQHQELLWTDIKYILGHNPLFPPYKEEKNISDTICQSNGFAEIKEGIYNIGYSGGDFCFDNEQGLHKVYVNNYQIAKDLITNGEYLEFIDSGGYLDFNYWHAEGWDWVNTNHICAPMYWYKVEDKWLNYTLSGLREITYEEPVNHISYYEAYAFAQWKGMRLPTEFEWEIAAKQFDWGKRWEWTGSAYLPYPGFVKADGAIGEYNGKFMVNQMILRGASEVTSAGHSRITYRNFFQPHLRWQYTGIRLVV